MATTTFREVYPNLPNEQDIDTRLEQIDQLKDFLANAPVDFVTIEGQPPIKRHPLPNGDSISCVQWNSTHFITGTDIVRCLIFRFHAFGRPVSNLKKFEEGIFSDLRNLKPGTDATLEEPKSSFLDLLYRHNCIRTQKKQKVFFWQSVPHDRLFLDALERDLKREKLSQEVTSEAVAYPANTITLDATQAMFDEFRRTLLCNIELEACLSGRTTSNNTSNNINNNINSNSNSPRGSAPSTGMPSPSLSAKESTSPLAQPQQQSSSTITTAPEEWPEPRSPESSFTRMAHSIFGQFSLFEGSPMYKQRRRKSTRHPSSLASFQSHPVPDPTDASLMIRSRWSPYDRPISRRGSSDEVLRSYFCPFPSCGKDFRRLEHLKRHLRTHTMERPYLCNVCGKRFSRSDNLAQHKKTHERRHHVFASDSSDEGTDKEDEDSGDETLEQFSPTQGNLPLKGLHDSHNPPYHHDNSTNTPDTAKHPDWIKTEPLDGESDIEDWVNPIPSLSGSSTFTSTASSCTSTPVRTKVQESIVEDEDDLFYRDGYLPSPTYMLSYTSAIYPLDDLCYPPENHDLLDSAFDTLEYQKATNTHCKREEEEQQSPLPSYVQDIDDYMHDCGKGIQACYELSSSSSSSSSSPPQSLTASPSQPQQISDLYLHLSQSGHGSPHPFEDYSCSSPNLSMLTSGFNYHIDSHHRSTMRPTDALIRF